MKNYKKRTLEDVKIYRLRVQQLKDMLDYITGKISAPRYGGVERGKTSRGYVDGNRIIYTVAEIMKTEEDLKIAQQHYNSVLAKAEKIIRQAPDAKTQIALKYHYCPPFLTLEQTAAKMHYSLEYIKKLIGRYLNQ